jgi:hypothetical protein
MNQAPIQIIMGKDKREFRKYAGKLRENGTWWSCDMSVDTVIHRVLNFKCGQTACRLFYYDWGKESAFMVPRHLRFHVLA